MTVLQAIILGLVQGLCEFLPVSSSGHLVLLQKIFGITEGAMFFTVMLHVATLFAVVWVFRKTLWQMLKNPLSQYPLYIILATVPTVIITLLLGDLVEESYSGNLLGWGFLITAAVLSGTEAFAHRRRKKLGLEEMGIPHALTVGVAQGLALLPGISRSGMTIAGGLFAGLDRNFAAEFSFLMSIPAILGATVLQVKDVIGAGSLQIDLLPVIVGMAAAFVSGLFAIKWMLAIVRKGKLRWFAIYTAILGVLVLADKYFIHIWF